MWRFKIDLIVWKSILSIEKVVPSNTQFKIDLIVWKLKKRVREISDRESLK